MCAWLILVGVEDGDGVVGEVVECVVRLTRWAMRGRLAGVSVVVADDKASGVGEALAEFFTPAEHRSARSVDQQDGRVCGVTE